MDDPASSLECSPQGSFVSLGEVSPRRIGDSHREWAKKRTQINKELQNPCITPGSKDRLLNTLSRIIRLLQNSILLFFYSAFFRCVNKVLVCIGILGRSQ